MTDIRQTTIKIPRIVCTREAHYIPNPVEGQADVFVPAAYEQKESSEIRFEVTDPKTGETHQFLTADAAREFLGWAVN